MVNPKSVQNLRQNQVKNEKQIEIERRLKKAEFLFAYPECFTVISTCKKIGISRSQYLTWVKEDAQFAADYNQAKEAAIELLESEARRRAYNGVTTTRYTKSGEPYDYTEYSDTLMIFLLKAANPQKYRDNSRVEVTGADGGPIQIREVEIIKSYDTLPTLPKTNTLSGPDNTPITPTNS